MNRVNRFCSAIRQEQRERRKVILYLSYEVSGVHKALATLMTSHVAVAVIRTAE